MTRRTALKIVHWSIVPLLVWFLLVSPSDVARWGGWAIRLHSVLGLVFVTLALAWSAETLRRGLASRPGPKLGPRARRLHRGLIWGLFGVAITGFLLGLTAARQLWAGGLVPIGVPLGLPQAHAWAGWLHAVEFYALAGMVAVHAGFHLWRHLHLRDNALRIMVPRVLHRYL